MALNRSACRMLRCGAAIVVLLGSPGWIFAEEMREASRLRLPRHALQRIRTLPIQHAGRHKPFDSFARETLDHLTGSPRIGREDPLVTVLSMIATPESWQPTPLLAVPFRPLRDALGMSPSASHVSQEELVTTRRLMRMLPPIVEKQRRDEKLSMLEQETMDLFDRFVALSNLFEHRLELVPAPSIGDANWRSIQRPDGYPPSTQAEMNVVWAAWITALRDGQGEAIETATIQLTTTLHGLNPSAYPPAWRLRLEVFYNQVAPFRLARFLYIIAFVSLLISLMTRTPQATTGGMVPPPAARPGGPIRRVATDAKPLVWAAGGGMAAFGIAAALHVIGILMRVVIGGRPPVSNFFETMLWLPFVGVVLAAIFERIYHARYFAFSAAVLAMLSLWLADLVPLDPSISPVVAVLRSNLWLTIHVLTIVASYGALALATVLAHCYGVLSLRRATPRATLTSLDLFLYRVIQVGVVLLASGVMLGAVWANASWGRYWGWDPKETWALITLLWFLAVLHGRFAGWLQGVGVALATIGGFFLLLMTYYGVSFYLVGLHSYAGGHAKPLPPLLIAYLIADAAFLMIVGARALRRHRAAPSATIQR